MEERPGAGGSLELTVGPGARWTARRKAARPRLHL
jgi:hypothetical protein